VVALFLAASYPFTKRFFAIPQAYLGIAFGFGIPMSYAALQGTVPAEAWILLAANVFWAIAYDTQYAMVDREDDLKIGIKTSAITFGRFDLVAIAICYAATLVLLGWVGLRRDMGMAFFGGLAAAAAIALYHMILIRQRDPQQCFRAFLHNTWFGATVFGGIALHYLAK
jgi:4-hydroxybenzoate polyprenyltransferase